MASASSELEGAADEMPGVGDVMIICRDRPRHKPKIAFWGVNESSSDHIAARHLHGTCASRTRRVRRTLCACLELR